MQKFKELQKIDNLLKQLLESDKDSYTFRDIVVLKSSLDRKIHIAEIDEDTGITVSSYINFYNRQDEESKTPIEERMPIKIVVDSPGGDLISTLTIIDAINNSKTPVWTINIGAAYSGGFFLFIAGHRRFCYKLSSFLFHEGSTGISSDAGKFRNYADFYKKQLDILKNITLEYTKISEKEYEDHINDDWWFTAEEAMQYGIVDEYVDMNTL